MSKPRRASPSMGDEVHMRLYDMSHGMAKNMSMPLLGRQVRSYLTLPGLWSHREAETPPRRVTRGSCPSYTGAGHTLARMTARCTHRTHYYSPVRSSCTYSLTNHPITPSALSSFRSMAFGTRPSCTRGANTSTRR